ncbi:MAG: response regulator [Candidatus Omnitrophica bacterium]|nr:response regulator [Candidatus Omnitrophota bacterium]
MLGKENNIEEGVDALTLATETEKGWVLVIDDDDLLTRTLKKVLEKDGYSVDVASNGQEGIKKAKSGFFHLVLCDIRMPGLDGLMTLQHIKEFQDKAGAGKSGFILVTAYDSPESRKRAAILGVSDFVLKPFDLKEFLETIHHHATPLIKETPLQEVERLNRKLSDLLSALHENGHLKSE